MLRGMVFLTQERHRPLLTKALQDCARGYQIENELASWKPSMTLWSAHGLLDPSAEFTLGNNADLLVYWDAFREQQNRRQVL